MKKLFNILLIPLLLISINVSAQCDDDDFVDDCADQLGDFQFSKVYNISEEEGVANYSVVLSKSHTYLLVICNAETQGTDELVVKLFDRNKKLISSSYHKSKKINLNKLGYRCSATGVYYIEAAFKNADTSSNCGVIILGFKKSSS